MLQKMFCYSTGPIDEWVGVRSQSSLERELGEGTEEALVLRSQLDRLQGACLAAFRELGWEGDFSEGPGFFQLPDPECCCFRWGFVVKQDNNGRCFIASPFPLAYLEEETRSQVHVEL
jgi:hypothetical protein